jgi:hypothetical protein
MDSDYPLLGWTCGWETGLKEDIEQGRGKFILNTTDSEVDTTCQRRARPPGEKTLILLVIKMKIKNQSSTV